MNALGKNLQNPLGRLSGLKQSVAAFWNERNQRERTMLSAAIVVIVLGLFWGLLIDPAVSGREELQARLPALRQQAAEVRAMAKEAAALSGQSAAPAAVAPITKESLEASATGKGLSQPNVSLSGDLAKVQLQSASFVAIVDWLDELQRTARVSVVEAKIDATEKLDIVNASFTLTQQRGEAQ